MYLLFDTSLPLQDPVLTFALVLFIILLSPVLLTRIKVPSVVGLIIAGVIIGPHGLDILEYNIAIILFSTVGLLYIMFLAGLELDIIEFKKNRNKSLIFGAITFIVPFGIGTLICYYYLNYGIYSSLLVSSMFSSHTLVAYPIASRLGLTKHEVVIIAVGGTIITDTAVLLVLAIVKSMFLGDADLIFWLLFILKISAFTFTVAWGFPRIGRWFFKNVEPDNVNSYIFIILMVFIAASLAELAGVEAIIGAFLAGLSLNRLIPHHSLLMNRIEFVGNAIFIPFFLIGVGMLVDVKVLFYGLEAFEVIVVLSIVAIMSKFVAAWITQLLFKYNGRLRNFLFGLSSAHAAATLAVIMVGFNIGLVDDNVLNATVVLILVTCMVSSFVVENVGKKLAAELETEIDFSHFPERILVPIANPSNIANLLELAYSFKGNHSAPIVPLAIIKDDEQAREKVQINKQALDRAIQNGRVSADELQPITRIDLNIGGGILRAVKEMMVTHVIVGWNGEVKQGDKLFGSILDNLIIKTDSMLTVAKIKNPTNTLSKIRIVIPPKAAQEVGFRDWLKSMHRLAKRIDSDIVLLGDNSTTAQAADILLAKQDVDLNITEFDDWENFAKLKKINSKDDLLVVISAKAGSVSHNPYLDKLPQLLAREFAEHSFLVVYPKQDAD
ncbi:MAG: cation:proton antiporter [Bernardetiaceae bacterium]|nr:cation:proton antiporter [Bernardetiaceae bacterium]